MADKEDQEVVTITSNKKVDCASGDDTIDININISSSSSSESDLSDSDLSSSDDEEDKVVSTEK